MREFTKSFFGSISLRAMVKKFFDFCTHRMHDYLRYLEKHENVAILLEYAKTYTMHPVEGFEGDCCTSCFSFSFWKDLKSKNQGFSDPELKNITQAPVDSPWSTSLKRVSKEES